jgi:peptidoglycan/xylan/chitin deacetylase (PgdA/CDA1 family)
LNSAAKTLIATAAHRSGLLKLLKQGVSRNVVLALHRVLPRAEICTVYEPKIAVTSESFDALLRFLSDNFQVVSTKDFLKCCNSRKDLATITFDDGWVDNYQHAFPLLQKHGLPATIFLPTGLINSEFRLPEQRVVDLWTAVEESGDAEKLSAAIKLDSGLTMRSVREAQSGFKKIPYEKKIEILDRQERAFSVSGAGRNFLSWDEVREMHRGGISFGSHTRNHAVLT